MNINLVSQIIMLSKNKQEKEIEKIFKEYLDKDPTNIDLWMRLALLYIHMPYVDYTRSVSCLEKVFELDPDNPQALLLYAYFHFFEVFSFSDSIMNRLNTIITSSNEFDSMFKYVMSWNYEDRIKENFKPREALLQKSVELYDGHVWNNFDLAEVYFQENKIAEAKVLALRALKNVVKVYDDSCNYDPTDVDEFINERIKGIYVTRSSFESIKEFLSKL